jgi:hypothetical protein
MAIAKYARRFCANILALNYYLWKMADMASMTRQNHWGNAWQSQTSGPGKNRKHRKSGRDLGRRDEVALLSRQSLRMAYSHKY